MTDLSAYFIAHQDGLRIVWWTADGVVGKLSTYQQCDGWGVRLPADPSLGPASLDHVIIARPYHYRSSSGPRLLNENITVLCSSLVCSFRSRRRLAEQERDRKRDIKSLQVIASKQGEEIELRKM